MESRKEADGHTGKAGWEEAGKEEASTQAEQAARVEATEGLSG